jgi:hypothetical protein
MTDKTTDTQATENARKRLDEERKLTEQSRAEYAERSKGKPTPTQEENDLAALGAHIVNHEDDGSGPDRIQNRQVEADKPSRAATYQTKAPKSE